MVGGGGSDVYVVDTAADVTTELAGEGTDTIRSRISLSLADPGRANIENLALIGTAAIDATGSAGNNLLTGNGAGNVLDGGGGLDTLDGGGGDDTYVVDTTTDTITELAGGGVDAVHSSVGYTLRDGLEVLVLTGANAVDGTGTASDDRLTGNAAGNRLTGLGGDDTLDGGGGVDTLIGGDGDDTYIVDTTTDTLTEAAGAGGGVDTVRSRVTFTLAANFEHLTLTGPDAVDGTGNGLGNALTGNAAGNVLTGLGGADTLDGGGGADTLVGGGGGDVYVIDILADVTTELAGGGVDTLRSSVTVSLADAARTNIEHLTLIGAGAIDGTGSAGNNVVTGNAAANVLDGGGGIDTLIGGGGDDTYVIDTTTDTLTETAAGGLDTVRSSVTYTLGAFLEALVLTGGSAIAATGNALSNALTGNGAGNVLTGLGGDDTLDGGDGIDTLVGGAGDDTYLVDTTTDVLTEIAGGGTDTVRSAVSFTLASHIENLVLAGVSAVGATGNALANTLTGNGGDNSLTGLGGNDTLDGGAGLDTMTGGSGEDTYVVDALGDLTNELVGEGIDRILSSVSLSLADAGRAEIENLSLIGAAAIFAVGSLGNNDLVGNAAANRLSGLAGDDVLAGEGGDDTLEGGGGADTCRGGSGDDSIVGAGGEDSIDGGEGADVVSGDANNDRISGDDGGDTLSAGEGSDTADGGAGADAIGGGGGNDLLEGGNDGDTLRGDDGADTAVGGSGADLLLGGSGSDSLDGGLDADDVRGNDGTDTLVGGAGADTLLGGLGRDVLVGGDGDDVFDINLVAESHGNAPGQRDEIVDMQGIGVIGGDLIDLAGIDANATLAGNQAFVFVSTAAFSAAGQLRVIAAGDNTRIQGNVDADTSTVEFEILALDGSSIDPSSWSALDFVL